MIDSQFMLHKSNTNINLKRKDITMIDSSQ